MNKKNTLILLLVAIPIILGYGWMRSGKKPNLVVINVLDKNLHDDAHIAGSICVPFEDVSKFSKKLDKNTNIVLYCSNYMCTASGAAARMLKKDGYNNVFVYEAGIADWVQSGFPTVGPCKEPYLKLKVEKPDVQESDVQHITTQELRQKIKKELNI